MTDFDYFLRDKDEISIDYLNESGLEVKGHETIENLSREIFEQRFKSDSTTVFDSILTHRKQIKKFI